MNTEERFLTHSAPVWRDKADCIVMASVEDGALTRDWEQLWGKEVGQLQFLICCIPFFVRGIELGDIVQTDQDYVVQSVINRSGQVGFRAWLSKLDAEVRMSTIHDLEEMNLMMEWYSENLLALSVHESLAQSVADQLQALEDRGLLQYETGRR